MVSVTENIKKNIGLYTLPEAAFYARMHPTTLKRWFNGDNSYQNVLNKQIIDNGERYISFLDFVQALAIREIRKQHSISLNKIREAVERAKSDHDVDFPFAKKHTTYLLGKEIYIQVDSINDPIQLSGKKHGQMAMKKIVEVYMEELSFDAQGFAIKYTPYPGIIMDPAKRFGEPMVESCGISAYALWEAAQSEGSFTEVANLFDVSENDVKTAYKYFDILSGKLAA